MIRTIALLLALIVQGEILACSGPDAGEVIAQADLYLLIAVAISLLCTTVGGFIIFRYAKRRFLSLLAIVPPILTALLGVLFGTTRGDCGATANLASTASICVSAAVVAWSIGVYIRSKGHEHT